MIVLVLLLVGGCGQPERPYTPRDAPQANSGSAAPSPAERGAASAGPSSPAESGTASPVPSSSGQSGTTLKVPSTPGVETVSIGDKVRVRIEWPADADPRLRLVTDFYVNSRQAVVTGDERYLDNLESEAIDMAYAWVQKFTDRQQSLRGVARLYDLRIEAEVGRAFLAKTCIDESGLRLISTRTGKAVPRQPDWTRKPYMEGVAARREDNGTWRIRTFVSSTEGCGR